MSGELRYDVLIGTGGIGSGILFALEGDHTLGREESRPASLQKSRDYCKLHIISHYVSVLLGSDSSDKATFQTIPAGAVGGDEPGERLLGMMKSHGMDVRFVEQIENVPTMFSVCFQYPDKSGGNITASNSASSMVDSRMIEKTGEVFKKYVNRGIALAAPEVALDAREKILELASRAGFLRISSFSSAEISSRISRRIISMSDIICLNRDEGLTLAGFQSDEVSTDELLKILSEVILKIGSDIKICLTLGAEGSYGFDDGKWEYTPVAEVIPVSTAGAGDAAVSGIIVALAAGLPFILPERPICNKLSERPVSTAMDFAALLSAMAVISTDTINYDINRETIIQYAAESGIALSDDLSSLLKRN